jgi:hypothetical protein
MARTTRPSRRSPSNTLNDLTGTEWIRFTRSWFVHDPPRRSSEELRHPGKFPETLCEEFVRYFTKPGMWVLDPFSGSGSALVAAIRLSRPAVGIELNVDYARLARRRLAALASSLPRSSRVPHAVLTGDSRRLSAIWARRRWPRPGLVLTSPPYADMLSKSRGGVVSVHRRRRSRGLDTEYSRDARDLANLHNYDAFVAATSGVLRDAGRLLLPRRYLVAIVQNFRDAGGGVRRLAWDLARALDDGDPLRFQGERIWCQNAKPLGIWGYPTTFVPNYHHHYCLVFRRTEDPPPTSPDGAGGRRG